MSPRELVAALENVHGVRFRVVGDRINIEAQAEPPRELLDELTRSKADVLAFLLGRETPPAPVRVTDKRAEDSTPPDAGRPPAPDPNQRPVTLQPGAEAAFARLQRRLAAQPGAFTTWGTPWGGR